MIEIIAVFLRTIFIFFGIFMGLLFAYYAICSPETIEKYVLWLCALIAGGGTILLVD
jgi:hypothetical protein